MGRGTFHILLHVLCDDDENDNDGDDDNDDDGDGGKRQSLALSSLFSDFSSRNLQFP